jgi:uncharacterized protein YndB with AHSA1/START domain
MTTTTTHGTFVIERRYDATPQRAFAAWADPAAKRAWFAEGEGWDIHSFEFDFREGGAERSRFRVVGGNNPFPPETTFGNETVFNEIVENERIIFTYSMDRDGVRFSVSLASVEFKSADKGTRLIFTEHGAHFGGGDGVKMREAGWNELLSKLDEFLSKEGKVQ